MANMTAQDKYAQMTAMQNALGNSGYQSALNQLGQQGAFNVDYTNMSTKQIEQLMFILTNEHEKRTLDTPLPAPTKRQLQSNPALKEAYEAMQIIMKLQGIK